MYICPFNLHNNIINWFYYFLHFTDQYTSAERIADLPEVPEKENEGDEI